MSGGFSKSIAKFAKDTKQGIDKKVRAVKLELFRSIILATPVDTGRARGNWQMTEGSPAGGTVERLDPSGAAAVSDILTNMTGAGGKTWLSNNLPYIEVLEYGGYPEGPNTVGGFSKQAPAGMVRTNFARVLEIVKQAPFK